MKDFETMAAIQAEKAKEVEAQEPMELDAEGAAVAEHKRLTFDVIAVDRDPLR